MAMLTDDVLLIFPETGEFPITVGQFRYRPHGWMFGDLVDEDVCNMVGYYVVTVGEAPPGDVVVPQPPIQLEDGTWFQPMLSRDFTPEENQMNLENAQFIAIDIVRARVEAACEFGAPYQFASGEQHIQLRTRDRVNLVGLGQKAERNPNLTFYFRTKENKSNPLTAAEIVTLTDFAFDAFTGLMEDKWAMEDMIYGCTHASQVPSREEIHEAIKF